MSICRIKKVLEFSSTYQFVYANIITVATVKPVKITINNASDTQPIGFLFNLSWQIVQTKASSRNDKLQMIVNTPNIMPIIAKMFPLETDEMQKYIRATQAAAVTKNQTLYQMAFLPRSVLDCFASGLDFISLNVDFMSKYLPKSFKNENVLLIIYSHNF